MIDVTFTYLFFYEHEGKEAVAIAYFQNVHFKMRHYQFPLIGNFLIRPIEKLLMNKGFHILVCGNLFRVDFPGFYVRQDRATVPEIFQSMQEFFKQSRPKPHAVLMKDWQSENMNDDLVNYGYQPWPGDLTMKLDLDHKWITFSDYVTSLKHKYAQRVRKIRSRCSSITRKELQLEDIEKYGKELETLYCNVVKKQVIRLVIATERYFFEMKKAYGPAFKVVGYFENEQMIAFSSHIIYSELWELHYIGMDYSKNEIHQLYYNIMYDGVEMAIDAGKRALELGRTAREAKAMLGGKPVYFKSYFRLRGWLVRLLVSRFSGAFDEKAGASWKLRQPFKTRQVD